MKINNISSPNFGYNAAYHKDVSNYLTSQKENKELALTMLEADKFTMSIEDKINLVENKQPVDINAIQALNSLFLSFKLNLASMFENFFPELNYCENEVANYMDEAQEATEQGKDEMSIAWRATTSAYINSIAQSFNQNIAQQQNQEANQNAINEQEALMQLLTGEKAPSDLVTLFEPSKSSPKGFEDVSGMAKLKEKLKEEVVDYIDNPELAKQDFEEYGIEAPRGFLFYGPPGCGKTYITEALASEADTKMFKMDISKLGSKFLNETSNNLEKAFDYVKEVAKEEDKPVLLFLDEVDSLAIKRGGFNSEENSKATTTLLKQIQEAKDNNIIVIAATNKYDMLDDAFVSRFDSPAYVGLPDKEQISTLLKSRLSKIQKGQELAQNDEEIQSLADDLSGYSNRSITFILNDAAKRAKNNNRSDITYNIVKEAIDNSELEKLKDEDFVKVSSKKSNVKLGFQAPKVEIDK